MAKLDKFIVFLMYSKSFSSKYPTIVVVVCSDRPLTLYWHPTIHAQCGCVALMSVLKWLCSHVLSSSFSGQTNTLTKCCLLLLVILVAVVVLQFTSLSGQFQWLIQHSRYTESQWETNHRGATGKLVLLRLTASPAALWVMKSLYRDTCLNLTFRSWTSLVINTDGQLTATRWGRWKN